MEFKLLMVAGIAYADIVPDNKKPIKDSNGNYTGWFEYKRLIEKDETSDDCKEFLQLLAVCHTVIPEQSEDDPKKIIFQVLDV